MPEPNNKRGDSQPPPLAETLPEDDLVVVQQPMPRSNAAPGAPRQKILLAPEADAAQRDANLLRVRGDFAGAEQAILKALAIEPTSGALHETLGDIQLQNGRRDWALSSYRRAQSCGAGASVEAKIARIVMQQQGAVSGLTGSTVERGQGPVVLIASLLVPGLGLALAGELQIAAISFAGWLITTALIFAIPATRAAMESVTTHAAVHPSGGAVFLLIVLGLANLAFYAYSLIETMRVAKPAEKDGLQD